MQQLKVFGSQSIHYNCRKIAVFSEKFVSIYDIALSMDKESCEEIFYSAEDLSLTSEMQQIKKWLTTEVPFNARTDNDFIKRFLIGSKNNVKKTKQRIIRYYENRKNYPELVTNRDITDPVLMEIFNRGVFICNYKELDESNKVSRVFSDFSKIKDGDLVQNVLRLALIFVESLLLIDNIVEEGSEWIVNAKDIPLSVIIQVTPKVLYRIVHCILIGLPIRLQAIHIINIHPAVMVVISCFKALLTPKLRGRLHLHKKSWSALNKYMPPHQRPNEFGGSGGHLARFLEKNLEVLFKSRSYLLEDEKYGK